MADPQASKHNTGPLSDNRLKYLTATLLQWISLTSFSEKCENTGLPYVKCEHNRLSEQLARHSKVTLELVRKIERYRKCSRGLLLNSYDKK